MGGREVGGLASTLAAHMGFEQDNLDRVRRFWDSDTTASRPGLKAVDLFDAIDAGRIRAVWIMATNPLVSLPDADQARRALSACEFVVVSDCMAKTDTTQYAEVLLPAAAWGEKDGTVTNSERRISRQRAFLPLPGEVRPDWWIISEVGKRMGYGEAFDYRHPADIFTEHARLSAFENDGSRLFDIGGLGALSHAEYDALSPRQWPLKNVDDTGSARLPGVTDSAQQPRSSRFVATAARPPVHAVSDDYPFILNSGRVRDHWHTLTRTGKSPRLSIHHDEPFVAVHPDDAAVLDLHDDALAEVETRWGRLSARVRCDDGQRRGELFVPIHWNDVYSQRARVGALVNPVVDPLSGEPEFKHTPARVRPVAMTWYGFLLTRATPDPQNFNGLDYWTRVRGYVHWRVEMAGREAQSNWAPWARRLLGAVRPEADWLEFSDNAGCSYRVASLDNNGRLDACLMLAASPAALPARDWLGGVFARSALDDRDRMSLLAGRSAGASDAGAIVCSCHAVGRNALIKAISEEGLTSTEALGRKLRAGTNCGACIPELYQLIASCQPADPAISYTRSRDYYGS